MRVYAIVMLVLLNLGLNSSTATEFGEKIPSTTRTDTSLKRTRLAKIASDIKARPYSTRYKDSETNKSGEDEVSNRDQISLVAAPPTAFVQSESQGKDLSFEDVIKKSQAVSDADPKEEDEDSATKLRNREKATLPTSTDLNKKPVRKRIASQRFRQRQRVQAQLGRQKTDDKTTLSEDATDKQVGESDVTEDDDSNDDDNRKNLLPYEKLRSGSVRRRGNNTFYVRTRGGERPNGQLSNSRGLRLRARFTTTTEAATLDSTETPGITTLSSVTFDKINSIKTLTLSTQKDIPKQQTFDSIGYNILPQNDSGDKSTSIPSQSNENYVSFKRQIVRVTKRPLGSSQRAQVASPETTATTPVSDNSPNVNLVTASPKDNFFTTKLTTASVPTNGFISPTSHIRSTVYQFGPSFSAIEHGKVNFQEEMKNSEKSYLKSPNHQKIPKKDASYDNTQLKKLKTSRLNRCDGVSQRDLVECRNNEGSLPSHILESTRDIIRQAQNEEGYRAGTGSSSSSTSRGRVHSGIRTSEAPRNEVGGAISFSSSVRATSGPESPWLPGSSIGQTTLVEGDFKRQYRSPSATLRQQSSGIRLNTTPGGNRLQLSRDSERVVTSGNLYRDDVMHQQHGQEGVSWRERRPLVELPHSARGDAQRDARKQEKNTSQDSASGQSDRPSVFATFDQFLKTHGVTETGFSAVPAPERQPYVKNTSSTPSAVAFQNSYVENVRQALEIQPPIAVRPGKLETSFTLNDHPNSIHSTKSAVASIDFSRDRPSTRNENRLPQTGFPTHAQDIYFSTPKPVQPHFAHNDHTITTETKSTFNINNFDAHRNLHPQSQDSISLTHSQPQNNRNIGTPNIQTFTRTASKQPSSPPKQSFHYSNVNSKGLGATFGQQGAVGQSISFHNQEQDLSGQNRPKNNKPPPPKRHISSVSYEPLHHPVSQNSKEPAFLTHQTRSRGKGPDPKTHFQSLHNENVPSTRSHFRAVLLEGGGQELSPAQQQRQNLQLQHQQHQQQQHHQLQHLRQQQNKFPQQQQQLPPQVLNRHPQQVNVGMRVPSAPGRLPLNAIMMPGKRPVRHFNPNRPPLVLGRGNGRPMRLRNLNAPHASGLSNLMRPPPRRRAHPRAKLERERQNSNNKRNVNKKPADVFQVQESRDNMLIARPHSQFIRASHFNAGGHKHRNEPKAHSQGPLNFNVPSSIPPTRNANTFPQFQVQSNNNRPQIVLNSRPPITSLPAHLQLLPNAPTRNSRHNSNFNTPPATSFAIHHTNNEEAKTKPTPTKPTRPRQNLVPFESQKQTIRVPSFYHKAPLVSFSSTTPKPVLKEVVPPRHYFQRQHVPSSSHVYNVHEELPTNDIDVSGISQPLPHQMLLKTSHNKMAESHVSLLKNLQFGVNGEPLDVWIPMKSEKSLQASSRSHKPQAVSSSVPGATRLVVNPQSGRAVSLQSIAVPVYDFDEMKDVLDGDSPFDYNDYDESIDRLDEPHAASSHEELYVAAPEEEQYQDYGDDDQEEEESQFGQREASHDDDDDDGRYGDDNHVAHDDEERR